MQRPKHRRPLIIAAAVIGVVGIISFGAVHVALTYVWRLPSGLSELLDDPMADEDLLGLTLVHSDVPGRSGPSDLKLPPAIVVRWFSPGDAQPAVVRDEIAQYAQSQGWSGEFSGIDDAWVGHRGPEQERLRLIVRVEAGATASGRTDVLEAVRVSLSYQ